jgi:hypothetical protein
MRAKVNIHTYSSIFDSRQYQAPKIKEIATGGKVHVKEELRCVSDTNPARVRCAHKENKQIDYSGEKVQGVERKNWRSSFKEI